jgi:hypothetical protein
MTVTETYTERALQLQDTVAETMFIWLKPVQSLMKSIPGSRSGLFDPGNVMEEAVNLTRRLVEVNAKYMDDLTTAVREHMAGLASVVNEGAFAAAKSASAQVEKVSATVEEQAHEVERAERSAARRVKKVAHDSAAEQYQDMAKVELSEELAQRGLPKSGNLDELRERLIESDLHEG